MFVHIFSFRWKPEATEAHRKFASTQIHAFDGAIPGLSELLLGDNCSPRSPDYTTTGVMMFDDQAAFDAYVDHPMHLALLEWLVPLIEAFEIDFTPMG